MQTILKLEDDYFVFNICLIIQPIIQEIGKISRWDISRNLLTCLAVVLPELVIMSLEKGWNSLTGQDCQYIFNCNCLEGNKCCLF